MANVVTHATPSPAPGPDEVAPRRSSLSATTFVGTLAEFEAEEARLRAKVVSDNGDGTATPSDGAVVPIQVFKGLTDEEFNRLLEEGRVTEADRDRLTKDQRFVVPAEIEVTNPWEQFFGRAKIVAPYGSRYVVAPEDATPTQAVSYRLAVMLHEGAKDEEILTFARTKAAELDVSVRDLLVGAAAVLMHQLNTKEDK